MTPWYSCPSGQMSAVPYVQETERITLSIQWPLRTSGNEEEPLQRGQTFPEHKAVS